MENGTNQHELEFAGKTYTLSKLTPQLKGKFLQVQAKFRMGLRALSPELLADPEAFAKLVEADPDLQLFMTGLAIECIPELLWDFLSPMDKQSIGTKDFFIGQIAEDTDELFKFQDWLNKQGQKTQDFLPDAATQEPESPSQSEPSSPPLPEVSDGQTETVPN